MWILNRLLAILRAAFVNAGLTVVSAATGDFVALVVIVFVAAQTLVVDSTLLLTRNWIMRLIETGEEYDVLNNDDFSIHKKFEFDMIWLRVYK